MHMTSYIVTILGNPLSSTLMEHLTHLCMKVSKYSSQILIYKKELFYPIFVIFDDFSKQSQESICLWEKYHALQSPFFQIRILVSLQFTDDCDGVILDLLIIYGFVYGLNHGWTDSLHIVIQELEIHKRKKLMTHFINLRLHWAEK